MGLDWQPLMKPKPGREEEFEAIYRIVYENLPIAVPRRRKWGLFRDRQAEDQMRDQMRSAFCRYLEEVCVYPWETIGAPCVGRDRAADDWLVRNYDKRKDPAVSVQKLLAGMRGYYVVDLAPDSDGLPVYTNGNAFGYCESYAFRGQLLGLMRDWLGNELVNEAWTNHRAAALSDYGRRLRERALLYARAQGISDEILERRQPPGSYESPALNAHIVMSAARWCQWWGERGHGMEAWY